MFCELELRPNVNFKVGWWTVVSLSLLIAVNLFNMMWDIIQKVLVKIKIKIEERRKVKLELESIERINRKRIEEDRMLNDALKEHLQILENVGPYEISKEKAQRRQRILQRYLRVEERKVIRKLWEIKQQNLAAAN